MEEINLTASVCKFPFLSCQPQDQRNSMPFPNAMSYFASIASSSATLASSLRTSSACAALSASTSAIDSPTFRPSATAASAVGDELTCPRVVDRAVDAGDRIEGVVDRERVQMEGAKHERANEDRERHRPVACEPRSQCVSDRAIRAPASGSFALGTGFGSAVCRVFMHSLIIRPGDALASNRDSNRQSIDPFATRK